MTLVIKWPQLTCFDGYPLSAIPAPLLKALQDRADYSGSVASFLLRLQFLSEISSQPTVNPPSTEADFAIALERFVAAQYSSRFLAHRQPWYRLDVFKKALLEAASELPFPYFPKTRNQDSWNTRFLKLVNELDTLKPEGERVLFWTGWEAKNSAGDLCRLRLWRFYQHFGIRRTTELFEAAREWFGRGRTASIPFVTEFAEWLILLVSDVTGNPLAPDTITQEIRKLRTAAGINERACPHMFRHRFITKLFVALVEQNELATPDALRRLLTGSEELKRKVAEWTNHSSLQTIDSYIDLAFEEAGGYARPHDFLTLSIALKSFSGTMAAERDALRSGEEPMSVIRRLEDHIERLRTDLLLANASPS